MMANSLRTKGEGWANKGRAGEEGAVGEEVQHTLGKGVGNQGVGGDF